MILVASDGFDNIISKYEGLQSGGERATMRALNRASASARTVEKRQIAGDTGLKQADVVSALVMTNATTANLSASLSASLKRLPLIKFNATGPQPSRGKGGGVKYRLGNGRSVAPNAFIATMRSGHQGVFARVSKKRLPIRELMGPSIGHVFIKFKPEAVARAEEIFVSNFEHEMSGQWGGTPVPSDPGLVPPNTDV